MGGDNILYTGDELEFLIAADLLLLDTGIKVKNNTNLVDIY